MSLWDDFKNFLESVGGAQASGINQFAVGQVQKEAAVAGASSEVTQDIATSGPIDPNAILEKTLQAEELAAQKLEPVVTALDKYVYDPTYEAMSAAALAVNEDTYWNGDERISFADGLSRAWDARKDVSFGQAVTDLAADRWNLLPDIGPLDEINKIDIDIYDQQARERIYSRTYNEQGQRVDSLGNVIADASWIENVARASSGSIDVTKQLVADPLVGLGKVTKAARLKNLDVMRKAALIDPKDWDTLARPAFEARQEARILGAEVAEKSALAVEARKDLDNLYTITADSPVSMEQKAIEVVNRLRDDAGLDPRPADHPLLNTMKEINYRVEALETDVIAAEEKIDNLVVDTPAPTLADGVDEFVNQIVDNKMTWDEIQNHRTIRDYSTDPVFLSYALAEAGKRGKGAVVDVLAVASFSDPIALARLRREHNSLITLIDGAQTKIDDSELAIQQALNSGDKDLVDRLNARKAYMQDYVKALKQDDEYLSLMTSTDNSIQGDLVGTPFSRHNAVEKFRANRARVKAGLDNKEIKVVRGHFRGKTYDDFEWERVQKSWLHRPTYVAQWVGHKFGKERPSGLVTVDGLDAFDGVKELQVMLDNVKVLKKNPTLRKELLDQYVSKTDSLSRKQVLEDVERNIVYETAKKYGVHNTTELKEINGKEVEVLQWEEFFKEFLQQRAKALDDFKKNKGFLTDIYGNIIENPVMLSQFDYAVPMIDTKALDEFFATKNTDPNVWKKNFSLLVQGKKLGYDPVYHFADKLWRADVLLRLGYPQRNVMQELTVLAQHDIGLSGFYNPEVFTKGAKNFLNNRGAYFRDIGDRAQATVDMANDGNKNLAKVRSWFHRVKWADYEEYVGAELEKLRAERDAIINFHKDLVTPGSVEERMGIDIDFEELVNYPKETIASLDARIALEESRLQTISEKVQARGDRLGTTNTVGHGMVRIGSNEFFGVFDGRQGKAAQKLISSGGRAGFDRTPFATAMKEMGLENTGQVIRLRPTDPNYYAHLAKVINNNFGGSPTAMKILAGETDEQILDYLRSPAGREELSRLNWTGDSTVKRDSRRMAGQTDASKVDLKEQADPAVNYLAFARKQIVENYLPTQQVRDFVYSKLKENSNKISVTSADLRRLIPKSEASVIAGEKAEKIKLWNDPALADHPFKVLNDRVIDRTLKALFKWLGEIPEDAFISNPFAKGMYESKLAEITDVWATNGITATPQDIIQAQLVARKWAVAQSRQYLYRVVRKNKLADSIPLLAPFAQAQFSTFKRIGKLAWRNPEKSARVMFAWNQLNTHAQEDDNGNRFVSLHIPPSWYDDKGLDTKIIPEPLRNAIEFMGEWRVNVNSFNMVAAGIRIATPDLLEGQEESTTQKVARWAKTAQSVLGVGPVVQMASGQLLRKHPAIDQEVYAATGIHMPARDIIEIFASPYPSEKWYDPIMSGWNKRVQSLIQGEGNADWERTSLVMFQNHLDAQRLGEEDVLSSDPKENEAKLWELAGKEASAFIALKMVVNLTSAFIPSYEGPMSGYISLYRQYQIKYGVQAYDKWLEHYPDMGYIAVSLNKNLSGSSQSTDAVYQRIVNEGLVDKAVSVASGTGDESGRKYIQMITNGEIGAEVLRDPYAGYWQRDKGDRITIGAKEGFENSKVREGWAWYANMTDSYNQELSRRGITSSSSAADQMNEMKRREIEKYSATNPTWGTEFDAGMQSNQSLYAVNFMRTVINDEKFMSSIPDDSWWHTAEKYLEIRESLAGWLASNPQQGGVTKNQREMFEKAVAPLINSDPTFSYYYYRYLDGDKFSTSKIGY